LLRFTDFRDAAAGLSVLYLSVWLYEIGNWVSLTAAGARASFLWSGILPSGVIGTSSVASAFPEAKLLQVFICVSVTLTACVAARRKALPITSFTLAAVTSMYISSLYWEMLSLTSYVPMILHEAIYIVLTLAVTFGLLRALSRATLTKGASQSL
jgi:hypothetical protein